MYLYIFFPVELQNRRFNTNTIPKFLVSKQKIIQMVKKTPDNHYNEAFLKFDVTAKGNNFKN